MSLSVILIVERHTSLVGVLELPGKAEIEGNEGRNGEWRMRGCLRIIQVGYEKVVDSFSGSTNTVTSALRY